MLIYCQYTHLFWCLKFLFISLVLRGCSPMDEPRICFTAVTWNPQGFPSPTITPILHHGHFPISDVYIWLIGALKTGLDGWVICLMRYCTAQNSQIQNPIITWLLPNVCSLMSETYVWFISVASTFSKGLILKQNLYHYTDVSECNSLKLELLVLRRRFFMSVTFVWFPAATQAFSKVRVFYLISGYSSNVSQ